MFLLSYFTVSCRNQKPFSGIMKTKWQRRM